MNYIEGVKFCTQAVMEGIALECYKKSIYQISIYGHPEVLRSVCNWESWRYRYEPSKIKGLHRVIYMSNCGVSIRIVYTFDPPFDKGDRIGWDN